MRLYLVPEPAVDADEVLVEVKAVGICGSELEAFRRSDGLRTPPLVMGHEIAGRAQNGDLIVINPLLTCGACGFCVAGRRQLCPERQLVGIHRPGGFAERVVVPTTACHRINDALPPALAAFVEPLATGLHALSVLHRLGSAPSRLAVIGAGAIGLATTLAALRAGLERIVVVDLESARRAAAHTLPVETSSELDGQYEAIVDAVGTPQTRAASLAHLTPGGAAVWLGLAVSNTIIGANDLVRRELRISGSYAYDDADFKAAISLATDVPPTWIEEVPLHDAAARFAQLAASPSTRPKTVIVP
jgi:threonine dehydrogenase-like Zn-dependent dehydrogenase